MKRKLASIIALALFAGLAAIAVAEDEDKPKDLQGFVLQRDDGTFFNLCVEDGKFKIYIYDKEKKKQKEIPWDRGRIQYEPNSTRRQSVFLTRSNDSLSMSAPQPVKHPYSFNFWLYLFKPGSDEVDQNITGRLVQMDAADGKSVSLYDMLPPDQQPKG